MRHEETIEIAQIAAAIHGHDWATLPHWSKHIWCETVRHNEISPGQSEMELNAAAAKDLWLRAGKTAPSVVVEAQAKPVEREEKPIERKSKNKR